MYADIQKDYKLGKKATVFEDIASSCNFLILKNRTLQKTRFVRSWLRVMKVGLFNVSTYVAMTQEALSYNKNTEAKKYDKIINNLTNPRNITLALGLCQILDYYSRCSVLVQSSETFPVSTWRNIKVLKLSLENISNTWLLKDELLTSWG